MREPQPHDPRHRTTRRDALQTGALGLMGLSISQVAAWKAQAAAPRRETPATPKSVIYLFLTGGPSQHDTFDMKPHGPVEYKGVACSFAGAVLVTMVRFLESVSLSCELPRLTARTLE